jgi:hypothetical protein
MLPARPPPPKFVSPHPTPTQASNETAINFVVLEKSTAESLNLRSSAVFGI